MGKKQISQLTFYHYVIGISIGSLAAEGAINRSIKFVDGLASLVVFALFSIVLSFISTKSSTGRKLLDGTPVVLIENGKIIEDGLKRSMLNINDLLEECRQKDIFDIKEIEFAILESSGRLSVLTNKPGVPKNKKVLCTNVIIDGKIIDKHLRMLNRDREWLLIELTKKDIQDSSSVLLAYVDDSGVLNTHLKNIKLENTIL